jgi:hypothetical protein
VVQAILAKLAELSSILVYGGVEAGD